MTRSLEKLGALMPGTAIGIAGGVAIVFLRSRLAGDALAFGGAIIAALLAVAGAVRLEDRKRRIGIADEAAPMLETLMLVERRTRPFFSQPGQRAKFVEPFRDAMSVLSRVLAQSPPLSGRLLMLFDRLRQAADMLTGELYVTFDGLAGDDRDMRHRAEGLLEGFDQPLKLLVIHYSRMVDEGSPRAVRHLGQLPEG